MSSNIKVLRICQHCSNEFTARTTTTLYCSHRCNSAAYKAKQRAGKVEQSNKETQRIKSRPIEGLKEKEFLTVTQVSKLIGCSRQNVYKLINTGKLKATNILEKKTIVKRSEVDKLFKEPTNRTQPEGIPETQKQELDNWVQAGGFDIADCYNLTEVQNKYGISEKALHNLIERNNIPKIKKGWYAYVPKMVIDKLLNQV
ncbi:MAG: helix-turn-helix domain-containing protein [Sphingobacteriaceae bacterium]|nr:helix-turn-helix domain-containing protein [Sphingobacteriaceae bacterium]